MTINTHLSITTLTTKTVQLASQQPDKNTAANIFADLLGGAKECDKANAGNKAQVKLIAEAKFFGIPVTTSAETTEVSFSANLSADQTLETIPYDASDPAKNMSSGNVSPDFTRNVTVYDKDGNGHTLAASFLKTGDNTWTVEVSAQAGDAKTARSDNQIASGTISFNADGTLKEVTGSVASAVDISWNNGEKNSLSLDMAATAKSAGLTQLATGYSVTSISQNGAPKGDLSAITVHKGTATASYTNGQTKDYPLPAHPLASAIDQLFHKHDAVPPRAAQAYRAGQALAG